MKGGVSGLAKVMVRRRASFLATEQHKAIYKLSTYWGPIVSDKKSHKAEKSTQTVRERRQQFQTSVSPYVYLALDK